jgi:nicotinamide-nucleotide amidase
MRAELLTIGSELTSGATINSNAAYLARRLAEAGIVCDRQVSVGDERTVLLPAMREALAGADLVILTGGLGPTFDDLTLDALAEVTGRPLRFHPGIAASLRRFYRRLGRRIQDAAMRQAHVPEGAEVLANPIGSAPGIWLPLERATVVALPGVPAEMRAIMERSVLPRLRRLNRGAAIATRTLRTAGVVELSIEGMLQRLRVPDAVQIGLYPHLRMVDVRLTAAAPTPAKAAALLRPLETALRRALGDAVYGSGDTSMEAVIGGLLTVRRLTIAVAESCTGGLVCDRLTDVPGSSRYVHGGVVAYHNQLKQGALHVPSNILERHGAVSPHTAASMAEGVRALAGTSIGLSVTGIAGPSGAAPRKPVGLVYFGLSDGQGTRTLKATFFGDRRSIKRQAAQTALNWLRLSLLQERRRAKGVGRRDGA